MSLETEIKSYAEKREARLTAELNAAADEISALNVGDGVTVSLWTDAEAYTIVKKTPKSMTLREDKATLIPGWKPEFVAGGFAGHCVNQDEQEYTYEPNPTGAMIKISLRTWKASSNGDERRRWKRSGTGRNERGGNVRPGRHKFHDYNF